jgi:hypothetical protein
MESMKPMGSLKLSGGEMVARRIGPALFKRCAKRHAIRILPQRAAAADRKRRRRPPLRELLLRSPRPNGLNAQRTRRERPQEFGFGLFDINPRLSVLMAEHGNLAIVEGLDVCAVVSIVNAGGCIVRILNARSSRA